MARTSPESKRAIRHAWLTDLIRDVSRESRGTYGGRRVHAELTLGRGVVVSHGAVAMLMRQAAGIIVSTWSGWVYVAFVIGAYSRRILGWRTATSMNTQLLLDAIEHAIWTAPGRASPT